MKKISVDDWFALMPNELKIDAVGLWQVVDALRDDYKLTGDELDVRVRQAIKVLLAAGAYPVGGPREDGSRGWRILTRYGETPEQISKAVIDEWHSSGKDPDVESVWFATKKFVGQ